MSTPANFDLAIAVLEQHRYDMLLSEQTNSNELRNLDMAIEMLKQHNGSHPDDVPYKDGTRLVRTPAGDIVAYPKHADGDCSKDFPGIYIDLYKAGPGESTLLACIEYDSCDAVSPKRLMGTLYTDLNGDSPTAIGHFSDGDTSSVELL